MLRKGVDILTTASGNHARQIRLTALRAVPYILFSCFRHLSPAQS